jgi:Zn-dependent protease
MQSFLARAIWFLPPFLLAISFHESAHAYVANRMGDPTAKSQGRITLNPLPHIDVIGLIVLLYAHFGWAKPVPVNPYNLKNPIKDNLWIALAGPAANLILAIISAIAYRIIAPLLAGPATGEFVRIMIYNSVELNIVLMVFNLFPLPPLDGFHIIEGLVSTENYIRLQHLQQLGPFILLGLILLATFTHFDIFRIIFSPVLRVLGGVLIGMPIGW